MAARRLAEMSAEEFCAREKDVRTVRMPEWWGGVSSVSWKFEKLPQGAGAGVPRKREGAVVKERSASDDPVIGFLDRVLLLDIFCVRLTCADMGVRLG